MVQMVFRGIDTYYVDVRLDRCRSKLDGTPTQSGVIRKT